MGVTIIPSPRPLPSLSLAPSRSTSSLSLFLAPPAPSRSHERLINRVSRNISVHLLLRYEFSVRIRCLSPTPIFLPPLCPLFVCYGYSLLFHQHCQVMARLCLSYQEMATHTLAGLKTACRLHHNDVMSRNSSQCKNNS